MSYAVYILRSKRDSSLYIGQTKDLESRLARHNGKREKSTSSHAPYVVIHVEMYATRTEAIKREKQLKSYKGGEALKKLFNSK